MDKPFHPTCITTRVLLFLAHEKDRWCTWGEGIYMPSVQQVFRVGTSEETQLRFMQILQRKGFVGGCDCGCRGDYVITPKGMEILKQDCLSGEQMAKEWEESGSYGHLY